jgi:hypothetical protein
MQKDAAIRFHLERGAGDWLRGYSRFRVFIDDSNVGAMRFGETRVFPVRGGAHQIRVRLRVAFWRNSFLYRAESTEGSELDLTCRGTWLGPMLIRPTDS